MKTKRSKRLWPVLAIFSAFAALGWPAHADSFVSGFLCYEVRDADKHEVALSGYSQEALAAMDEFDGVVEVPAKVTNEGQEYDVVVVKADAFKYWNELVTLRLPDSITQIGEYAFADCCNLVAVNIPPEVNAIGKAAFTFCEKLSGEIIFPETLTEISNYVFSYCERLEGIVVPPSVQYIGSQAFQYCTGLRSVRIEASEKSLGLWGECFDFCGIEDLYVGRNLSAWQNLPTGPKLKKVEIGSLVTEIGDGAFSGCTQLSSLVIPPGVTTIGAEAFAMCSGLPSLEIPETVSSIGRSAFYGCSGLGTIRLNEGITELPDYVFWGCSGLESMDIPSGVTRIGDSAFMGCSGLESMDIPSGVTRIGDSAFKGCTGLGSIEIPGSVSRIDVSAFEGCTGLESLRIPAGTESVGSLAFAGCTGIRKLEIADGETELRLGDAYGNHAFKGCEVEELYVGRDLSSWEALCNCGRLSRFGVGPLVTSIGRRAFSGCSGLLRAEVPSGVTALGDGAFEGCSSMKEAMFWDGASRLAVGEGVFVGTPLEKVLAGREMDRSPFRDCESLRRAWVSDMVGALPEGCFSGCASLERLYLGDGLTRLRKSAAGGCGELGLLTLGRNIARIDAGSLEGCTGLAELYAEAPEPPAVEDGGLAAVDKSTCTLHYPAGAPYGAAAPWDEFLNADNEFPVTLAEAELTAEAGETVELTAKVAGWADAEGVAWYSSNPSAAEISGPAQGLSVKVLVHREEQATIAAFLPTGQMASCIVNRQYVPTSVEEIAEDAGAAGPFTVYGMDGKLLLRSASPEQLRSLPGGIYIANGRKLVVR